MTREIMFRGMDIQGRWFYGNLAILTRDVRQGHKKGHYISNSVGMPFAYQVRPETVGQFTGLKDSKGLPIYEGDILRDRESYDEIYYYRVTWHKANCCFYFKDIFGTDWFGGEDLYLNQIEVIDNVYENKEGILPIKALQGEDTHGTSK